MTRVTITEQIAAIKEKYPDYWSNPAALREAMAAWGVSGGVSDAGLFTGCEEQTVATTGKTKAVVRLRQVWDGVFVHGVEFSYSQGGMTYQPSVWRSEPYPTRAAAVQAGIDAILNNIDRLGPVSGAVIKAEMRQVRNQLTANAQQPTLF